MHIVHILQWCATNGTKPSGKRLRKHGVDFADAVGVSFDDHALTRFDPDSKDENRMVTIGLGASLRILYVVWVERHGDAYRVISARKASPGEIHQYQE